MASRNGGSAGTFAGALLVLMLAAIAWFVLDSDDDAQPAVDLALDAPTDPQHAMELKPGEVSDVPDTAPLDVPTPDATAPLAATGRPTTTDDPVIDVFVVGRLLAENGRPIPGGEVFYVPGQSAQRLLGLRGGPFGHDVAWDELPSTRSDVNGRFELTARDFASTAISTGGPGYASSAPSISVRADGYQLASRACPPPVTRRHFDVGDVVLVPGGRIVGRVVDERGSPVGGASLVPPSFISHGEGERAGEWKNVLGLCSAVTSPDGRFELASMWDGGMQFRVRAPGFAAGTLSTEAHAGEPVDVGDFVLEAGGTISGRVLDGDGAPRADLLVFGRPDSLASPPGRDGAMAAFSVRVVSTEAEETHTRSDADGRFVLADLPAAERYRVLAGGDDLEPAMELGVEPGTRDLELVVHRQATIVLRVRDAATHESVADVDAEGSRLSGDEPTPWDAALRILTEDDARTSLGDEREEPRGLVLLSGAGRRNVITVRAPGYADAKLLVEDVTAPARVERVVELVRGARIRGVVVDDTGSPVPEAMLVVMRGDPALSADRIEDLPPELDADGEGVFELDGIPPGPLQILPSKPGHLAEDPLQLEVVAGVLLDDVRVLLPRAAVIEGVLLGTDGRPAAGVRVSALGEHQPRPPERFSTSTFRDGRTWYDGVPGPRTHAATSDDEGRFAFDALPQDTYMVGATPGAEERVSAPAGETRFVTLRLRRPPVLEVVVLGLFGPVPLAETRLVRVTSQQTREVATKLSDGEGRITFTPEAAGEYAVAAKTGESWMQPQLLALAWGETREVELRAGRGSIRGLVFDAASGLPVPGARVDVQPGTPQNTLPFMTTLTCDDEGRFASEGLPGGAAVVSARADGYVRGDSLVQTLPVGDLEIPLQPGAVLEVRVVRPSATGPTLHVVLDALDDPDATRRERDLPSDGRLRFDGLHAGAYTLRVSETANGLWGVVGTRGPLAERRVVLAPAGLLEEVVPVDV